ncbi:hypothetical protein Tco_0156292 [Tanacetum coccineum]
MLRLEDHILGEQNLVEPRNESKVKLEFSKELLTELQNNTFSERCEEDVIGHICKVLKILDLVKIAEIGNEEGLLNDKVLSDEEWEEHEYGNPPNDSFPKPYLNINNEKDKNHHNENNRDADKLSGMDLSGAPQSEKINNEQPNEGVHDVKGFNQRMKVVGFRLYGVTDLDMVNTVNMLDVLMD